MNKLILRITNVYSTEEVTNALRSFFAKKSAYFHDRSAHILSFVGHSAASTYQPSLPHYVWVVRL